MNWSSYILKCYSYKLTAAAHIVHLDLAVRPRQGASSTPIASIVPNPLVVVFQILARVRAAVAAFDENRTVSMADASVVTPVPGLRDDVQRE